MKVESENIRVRSRICAMQSTVSVANLTDHIRTIDARGSHSLFIAQPLSGPEMKMQGDYQMGGLLPLM